MEIFEQFFLSAFILMALGLLFFVAFFERRKEESRSVYLTRDNGKQKTEFVVDRLKNSDFNRCKQNADTLKQSDKQKPSHQNLQEIASNSSRKLMDNNPRFRRELERRTGYSRSYLKDHDGSDFLTSLVVSYFTESELLGFIAGQSISGSLIGAGESHSDNGKAKQSSYINDDDDRTTSSSSSDDGDRSYSYSYSSSSSRSDSYSSSSSSDGSSSRYSD